MILDVEGPLSFFPFTKEGRVEIKKDKQEEHIYRVFQTETSQVWRAIFKTS